MPAPPTWPTQGLRRAGLRTMRGRRTRGTGRGGWRCCLRRGAARRASGGRGCGGTARGRVRGRRRPWMRSLAAAIRGCRGPVRCSCGHLLADLREPPQRRGGGLLRNDAVAERLKLVVAADADGGVCDVTRGQAHHPLDERGRQAWLALGSRFGGQWRGASDCGFVAADRGLVLAPVLLPCHVVRRIPKAVG